MERLTRRSANGTGIYATPSGEPVKWENNRHNVLQKLADYEDLEEQGRLVKLPCNDVYFIIDINNPKYAMVMKRPIRELTIYEIENIDKSGCKYFSTEEKAEAKLKELRGGENESSN